MWETIAIRWQSYITPSDMVGLWGPALFGIVLFFILERLFPARPPSIKGFLVSLKASVFYLAVAPVVAVAPAVIVQEVVSHWDWRILLSMPTFALEFDNPRLLPHTPSLMAIALFSLPGLLIYDFFYYWYHRLQHSSFLWGQHKLHHSDADMCVTTAYRIHWLEDTLRVFFIVLPMSLIFNLRPLHAAWAGYVIAMWGIFGHANVRVNLGWLTPVFVGPQLHRIHHSLESQHQNKNFAAQFPLWDIVFGTYYRPKRGEFPQTGVPGEPSALTWREMVRWPINRKPEAA